MTPGVSPNEYEPGAGELVGAVGAVVAWVPLCLWDSNGIFHEDQAYSASNTVAGLKSHIASYKQSEATFSQQPPSVRLSADKVLKHAIETDNSEIHAVVGRSPTFGTVQRVEGVALALSEVAVMMALAVTGVYKVRQALHSRRQYSQLETGQP